MSGGTLDDAKAELARRHIRDGEWLVARQRAIIEELSDKGYTTRLAEDILAQLQEALCKHRQYLDLVTGIRTRSVPIALNDP